MANISKVNDEEVAIKHTYIIHKLKPTILGMHKLTRLLANVQPRDDNKDAINVNNFLTVNNSIQMKQKRKRSVSRELPGGGKQHRRKSNFLESRSSSSNSVLEFMEVELEECRARNNNSPSNRQKEECMEDDIFSQHQDKIFIQFFSSHTCLELIESLGPTATVDACQPLNKAFAFMINNQTKSAPIWDSAAAKFVGILSFTDFIQILHKDYRYKSIGLGRGEDCLKDWGRILGGKRSLVYAEPKDDLYSVLNKLWDNNISHLPIFDPSNGNFLQIITQKRIFIFLCTMFKDDIPSEGALHDDIGNLNVGKFRDLVTVKNESKLIEALSKFANHGVSSLPVLDELGRVVNVFAKEDIVNASTKMVHNNLDMSLEEALKHRPTRVEKCLAKESLVVVMDRMAQLDVNKLVVVSSDNILAGIITVSDILKYLVFGQKIRKIRKSSEIRKSLIDFKVSEIK